MIYYTKTCKMVALPNPLKVGCDTCTSALLVKWLFCKKRMWDRTCLSVSSFALYCRYSEFWVPRYRVPARGNSELTFIQQQDVIKYCVSNFALLMCTLGFMDIPPNQKQVPSGFWLPKAHHTFTFCLDQSGFTGFDTTLHIVTVIQLG